MEELGMAMEDVGMAMEDVGMAIAAIETKDFVFYIMQRYNVNAEQMIALLTEDTVKQPVAKEAWERIMLLKGAIYMSLRSKEAVDEVLAPVVEILKNVVSERNYLGGQTEQQDKSSIFTNVDDLHKRSEETKTETRDEDTKTKKPEMIFL